MALHLSHLPALEVSGAVRAEEQMWRPTPEMVLQPLMDAPFACFPSLGTGALA